MKKILVYICFLMITTLSYAENQTDTLEQSAPAQFKEEAAMQKAPTKAQADSAYMNADYATAIHLYETLLEEKGEAAEVYYNLGNSYYKTENIAKAIVNYERALLLKPGNGDFRANLEIARAKTVDKVTEVPEIFFVSWIKSLINSANIDVWARWSIAFFLLFIVALYFFFFSKSTIMKKIGFFGGVVVLIFAVTTMQFASYQRQTLLNRKTAIIMNPSVTIRSTPNESGTNLFILHEGKKVRIKDNSMRNWKEIMIEDGKVGWVSADDIEII
ncbi:tetratricopeptide repeat protein [Bacteroides sp. 214]|uniref:tetratricopeptide repeat protein n=1 Tax=Bacteroides sp. 214 TaxID=2302935 RepID=UPI0013D6EE68|nr:tetratricopeptide repeat protein [Bacteroides sp. 214]NDW12943.1 tetratricopeptide repeat protein [Bacteroides sp. 214]